MYSSGRCAGKEITLLMQTLNTLSTPDEKLAGLCKKYAELVRGLLHRLHIATRGHCWLMGLSGKTMMAKMTHSLFSGNTSFSPISRIKSVIVSFVISSVSFFN